MNPVDICNRALARLGEKPNISSINPPEGSVAAEHCARFYPMVLATLLERHPWTFARKRQRLALTSFAPGRWEYAYTKPHDCVRILNLFSGDNLSRAGMGKKHILVDKAIDTEYYEVYRIDNQVCICTDVSDAFVEYITNDVSIGMYSPAFVEALSLFLAVDLAGAIIGGDTGMKVAGQYWQMAEMAFAKAAQLDAGQQHIDRDYLPEAILSR